VQNSRTGFLRIIRLGASALKRPASVASAISFPLSVVSLSGNVSEVH
jgi:hypothetical protein